MNVDEASHQTVFLEQRLDEMNVTHQPANNITDEECMPTVVEEAALSLPGNSQGQLEISDSTQIAPKPESDGLEEIRPITETPVIQRAPSVPPTSVPENDFNAMDVDTTPAPVTSVGAPGNMSYATNDNQVSVLPLSPPTSEDSQSE